MSLTLRDVYKVRLDSAVVDMNADEKQKLLSSTDSVDEQGKRRGLIITFDLSSSLRRTNNRLYTPRGQRDHVESWTTPYPKPILLQHDRNSDPIGRFIDVKWVSNDAEAMKFFDSMSDFMDFKRTAESDDPRKIYKAMTKHNLLTNDAWPGIGKLVARARISDPEAIEKFLDGRYMTFSAGSHTNRYCCGQCGSDWAQGDVCEHTPGSISDDGLPGVYITGAFYGDEGSVATMPGNSISLIRSMEFGDTADVSEVSSDAFTVDSADIQFIDAIVDTGDIMADTADVKQVVDALKAMDARDIIRGLWDGTLTVEQVDALAGKSHYEISWLVRVHDALHAEYDWRLRYSEEDALEVPDAVFAFHGDIHELSEGKGFRDSLINGPLDSFNRKGEGSTDYISKRTPSKDAEDSGDMEVMTPAALVEMLEDEAVVEALKNLLTAPPQETETDGAQEEEVVTDTPVVDETLVDAEETDAVDLSGLDWFLLSIALDATLGEDKLEADKLEALEDSAFVGPERTFPVVDAAHVAAARKVADQMKCSDEERAAFVAALDKFEADVCPPACTCDSADTVESLQKDYAASLELATKLKNELDSLKIKLGELDSSDASEDNVTIPNVEDIQAVDSPSESSANALAPIAKELGDYERKIVSTYKELRDSKGEASANHYLRRKIAVGHLSRSFDITPYIQENE
jgi:hypothetical protein